MKRGSLLKSLNTFDFESVTEAGMKFWEGHWKKRKYALADRMWYFWQILGTRWNFVRKWGNLQKALNDFVCTNGQKMFRRKLSRILFYSQKYIYFIYIFCCLLPTFKSLTLLGTNVWHFQWFSFNIYFVILFGCRSSLKIHSINYLNVSGFIFRFLLCFQLAHILWKCL